MKTLAVRLHGMKDLRLEAFELPPIQEGEILAKIVSDSICMSSYKAAKQGPQHKRVPDDVAENPIIIGHEFCGEIVEVGAKWADKFKAGDKFSIQPAMNDESGPVGILSAPGYSYQHIGGDAQYIVIPEAVMINNCLLPFDGEAFYQGSLAEPVSCIVGGFHANYHTTPGSYVHDMGIVEGGAMALLAGVGPMGLGAIDYAIHCDRKPSLLVVTDIDTARLERAASIYTVEEAKANGVELIYEILCMPAFYAPEKTVNHPILGFPETPEQIQATRRFVTYICKELKGTVHYWELLSEHFNEIHYPVHEPGQPGRVPQKMIDAYVKILREVAPVIRQADPANKVMFQRMASICVDGVEGCFKQGVAGLVDFISWNPAYWLPPEQIPRESIPWAKDRPEIKTYVDAVNELRRVSETYDYKGGYMADGAWWHGIYPQPPNPEETWPYHFQSDLLKAKYCARTIVLHSGMGMVYIFCNTFTSVPWVAHGFIKTVVPSALGPRMVAEPAYYIVRSLATMLDGAEPCKLNFSVATDKELMRYAFALPDGNRLITLWQPIDGADDFIGNPMTVTLKGLKAKKILAQDPLNGVEQELTFSLKNDALEIPDVMVKDYPLLIKIIR